MSADSPVVTVVMPAFNAAPWISRAVDSVLAQTIPGWDLVIVDDGSTDSTATIAAAYVDPRVHLIHQENGGAGRARNVGFNAARGRYIALLDADDWYETKHLQRSVEFLDSHQDCSLVGSNFHFVDHSGERTLGCGPSEILGRPGDGVIPDYFSAAIRNRCFPITCCAVFRRERLADLGSFDESLPSDEDHDFWTRWAMKSRFGYIDEPLSNYQVDTPASNRKDLDASIEARVRLWKKIVGLESTAIDQWESYSRFRSFYLFRLCALAVAVGKINSARHVSSFWPRSPRHRHWWLGGLLMAVPDSGLKVVHRLLGNTDLVRYRQGREAPKDDEDDSL